MRFRIDVNSKSIEFELGPCGNEYGLTPHRPRRRGDEFKYERRRRQVRLGNISDCGTVSHLILFFHLIRMGVELGSELLPRRI